MNFIVRLLTMGMDKRVRYAEDLINKGRTEAALTMTQDDIYKSMYPEAKELFKDAMKNKKLSREQIIYIKSQINDCLGENRKFYSSKYSNDAHEIYTKLKSPFLSNRDFTRIIKIIDKFAQ